MHALCLLPLALFAAGTPEPPKDEMTRLARSNNAFAFDLYRGLGQGSGNRVVSPASVTTALAMAWGGARDRPRPRARVRRPGTGVRAEAHASPRDHLVS